MGKMGLGNSSVVNLCSHHFFKLTQPETSDFSYNYMQGLNLAKKKSKIRSGPLILDDAIPKAACTGFSPGQGGGQKFKISNAALSSMILSCIELP